MSRFVYQRKRAVSPIIATILLVAITVVLAAVLYILVSGLIGGGGSKPYSVGFGSTGAAVSANGKVFYDNFTLTATSGLTTGLFGLKITSPSGSPVGSGAAVCTAASGGFAACSQPSGANQWYVVIVSSSGTWLASYPTAAGGSSWNGGTVAVSGADILCLVSSSQYSGSADVLSATATGSSTVSGQTTL
jgi:flagellin-like protein